MERNRILAIVLSLGVAAYAVTSQAAFKQPTIDKFAGKVYSVLKHQPGFRPGGEVKITKHGKTSETGAPNLFKGEYEYLPPPDPKNPDKKQTAQHGTVYFTPSGIADGVLLMTTMNDSKGNNLYEYSKMLPTGPEILEQIKKMVGHDVQIVSEMSSGQTGPTEHVLKVVRTGFGNVMPGDAWYSAVARWNHDENKYQIVDVQPGERLKQKKVQPSEQYALFGTPWIRHKVLGQLPGVDAVYNDLNDIMLEGTRPVEYAQIKDLIRNYLGGSNVVEHKFNIPSGTFDDQGKRIPDGPAANEVKYVDPFGNAQNPLRTIYVEVAQTTFGTIPLVVRNADRKVLFRLGAFGIKPKDTKQGGDTEITQVYDDHGHRVIPRELKQHVPGQETKKSEEKEHWETEAIDNEWLDYYGRNGNETVNNGNGTVHIAN